MAILYSLEFSIIQNDRNYSLFHWLDESIGRAPSDADNHPRLPAAELLIQRHAVYQTNYDWRNEWRLFIFTLRWQRSEWFLVQNFLFL